MSSPTDGTLKRHRIAVDAMGGDEAPANVVQGVADAVRMFGERIDPILVGNEPEIRDEIQRIRAADLRLEVVHAEQRVDMSEGGADSFRKKKDSSLNVATRLVRDGSALGVFSAGNTGAMVAASLLNLGRIPGVNRPAIATLVPTEGERPWGVMLDVGATSDCRPHNLLQFAVLGEVFARLFLEIEAPRVGLLNIGEESSKGTELAQEAHKLLAQSGLNFVGNVEGSHVLQGGADVVVTDGFTGNVILKFAENVMTTFIGAVREETGEHILAKIGALLLKPSLRRFKSKLDYTEYGGAPLLGVNGVAIIGHGRSNPKAIRNAMRVAAELIDSGITEEISEELERVKGGKLPVPKSTVIRGPAYYPPRILTNENLEQMVDTSDEWIRSRTGITERRIADPEIASSDLALNASKEALNQAGWTPDDVDMIMVATVTADYPFPSCACTLQSKLGATRAAAFDLSAACSGFIYGLSVGQALILSQQAKRILLVAVETLSRITDYTDRSTCILFGDAAGAVALEGSEEPGRGILSVVLGSDGDQGKLLYVPGGGSRTPTTHETVDDRLHFMKMAGNEVFKIAVRGMASIAKKALEQAQMKVDDIDWFIPHQANIRIIDATAKRLEVPPEKVVITIDRFGNTSAASIPLALSEAVKDGRIVTGKTLGMVAFGGGLTWGASVVRWGVDQ